MGAAFRSRDANKARELAERIDEEGVDAWKLDSTIADLADAVHRAVGTPEDQALDTIFEDLKALLAEVSH